MGGKGKPKGNGKGQGRGGNGPARPWWHKPPSEETAIVPWKSRPQQQQRQQQKPQRAARDKVWCTNCHHFLFADRLRKGPFCCAKCQCRDYTPVDPGTSPQIGRGPAVGPPSTSHAELIKALEAHTSASTGKSAAAAKGLLEELKAATPVDKPRSKSVLEQMAGARVNRATAALTKAATSKQRLLEELAAADAKLKEAADELAVARAAHEVAIKDLAAEHHLVAQAPVQGNVFSVEALLDDKQEITWDFGSLLTLPDQPGFVFSPEDQQEFKTRTGDISKKCKEMVAVAFKEVVGHFSKYRTDLEAVRTRTVGKRRKTGEGDVLAGTAAGAAPAGPGAGGDGPGAATPGSSSSPAAAASRATGPAPAAAPTDAGKQLAAAEAKVAKIVEEASKAATERQKSGA